jgi:hypothetical protein
LKGDRLLANETATGRSDLDLAAKPGHFPARARSVIVLFQNGGPSQMDLFDPKPELQKRDGQRYAERVEVLQPGNSDKLFASPFRFARYGQSGMDFSNLVPRMSALADDVCLIRSMHTENNNHPQAVRVITAGKIFTGRPTLGAWVTYALGTENQNLPAYVALRDPKGYNSGGSLNWDNGWLPALYRGTELQSQGPPVLNLHPAVPLPNGAQRHELELLNALNTEHHEHYRTESELETRIKHYELAARMQLSAEHVLDLSNEPRAIRELYGLDNAVTADYGKRCLMARRLVEAGVRFIHIEAPFRQAWDNHTALKKGIEEITAKVDQPSAALIFDLKQRGLLDETIVLWTGEFGRLPVSQNGNGRDHNRHAFSLLVAGGGFKAGHIHGETDDFGYRAIKDRVSCQDLQATILHQLGIDHEELTYRHNGRNESLTDPSVTHAEVVETLLANPAGQG